MNGKDQLRRFLWFLLAYIFPYFFFSSLGFAARVEVPVSEVEKVVIQVPHAKVRLILRNTPVLGVSGLYEGSGSAYLIAEKRGNSEVWIRSKTQLSEVSDDTQPQVVPEIEIAHPTGVPINIGLLSGAIEVQGWVGGKKVEIIEGQFRSQKTKGSLDLLGQSVEVLSQEDLGGWSVAIAKGKSEVRNHSGDLIWKQLSGSLKVLGKKGNLSLQGVEPNIQISNTEGNLNFNLERGRVDISDFSGRAEGELRDTNLSLLSPQKGSLDLQLRFRSGKAQLKAGDFGLYHLRLKTQTGEILAPRAFKITRLSREKSLRYDPEGEGDPLGRLQIQTTDGDIVLK